MSAMTYTKCEMCSRMRDCLCAQSPTPGWAPTGLTLGQIERMVQMERVLQQDPGVNPNDVQQVIARLESMPLIQSWL